MLVPCHHRYRKRHVWHDVAFALAILINTLILGCYNTIDGDMTCQDHVLGMRTGACVRLMVLALWWRLACYVTLPPCHDAGVVLT